jgi:hypothetical protein
VAWDTAGDDPAKFIMAPMPANEQQPKGVLFMPRAIVAVVQEGHK